MIYIAVVKSSFASRGKVPFAATRFIRQVEYVPMTNYLPSLSPPPLSPLFIFVDEAGNFDFSSNGTKYLILTAVSSMQPFWWYPEASTLKYSLLFSSAKQEVEYFHASEDSYPTRAAFFSLIERYRSEMRIDSVVIEKRKAHPSVRSESRFYPEHLTRLLTYVITGRGFTQIFPETIVFTDSLPFSKKRRAVEGAVKSALKRSLQGKPYRIYHHQSRSHAGLQVADYCCWAIQRKWNKGLDKEYKQIKPAIRSEFDVYLSGTNYHY